ncbi:MAG: hypothetical protein R3F60_33310 [bacterium]
MIALLLLVGLADPAIVALEDAAAHPMAVWMSHGDADADPTRFDGWLMERGLAVRPCMGRLADARPELEVVDATLVLRSDPSGRVQVEGVFPRTEDGGLAGCLASTLNGHMGGGAGYAGYRLQYAQVVHARVKAEAARDPRPALATLGIGTGGTTGGLGTGRGIGGGGMATVGRDGQGILRLGWTDYEVGDAAAVRAGATSVGAALVACFSGRARLRGEVVLEIGPKGPAHITVTGAPPATRRCAAQALEAARFPATARPGPARFSLTWYPGSPRRP